MTSAYSLLGNGPQKSISTVSQGLSGSFIILAGSVCCVFVAIWQSKQVLTTVSMREFIAGNQYFRRSISLVLLLPKCPCLWAISIILSLSDSGGMILSILRISPSAMYSYSLRSMYGLRSGSVLVHLPVCMADASFVSSLSFAVSSLILSRTTACSDWTVAMTYFSRWSVPVSGNGCLDM